MDSITPVFKIVVRTLGVQAQWPENILDICFLKSSAYFKEGTIGFIAQKTLLSKGGPTFSRGGGGPPFSKGVQMLISFETHIRDHARGRLGRSCLPFLPHFALSIWNREVDFAFKFQELFTLAC